MDVGAVSDFKDKRVRIVQAGSHEVGVLRWRDRFFAASTYWLKGSGAKDNDLVKRVRAAL